MDEDKGIQDHFLTVKETNDNILVKHKQKPIFNSNPEESKHIHKKADDSVVRLHSQTVISQKERDIITKIKEKKIEGQKDALKKLIWVSIISCIFIGVEIWGGIMSGSLSIMSDGLHLFSDFSGFAISMISIIISKNKPTDTLSYGYHRAEVLGALGSVFMIWIVIGVLVYEGIHRIVTGEYEIQDDYMLIVAIVGLICNIISGIILHSGPGHHHHHGHSHGHSHGHDHGHSHGHSHGKKKNKSSHDEKDHDHDHEHKHKHLNDDEEDNHDHDHKHEHKHDHDHKNGHKHENKHEHDHEENNDDKEFECDHNHDHKEDNHNHKHSEHSHKHSHNHKHKHNHKHNHSDISHDTTNNIQGLNVNESSITPLKPSERYNKHEHKHEHKHDHNHDHHDHDHDHDEDDHDHDDHSHENMNVKAAMIHVIGDLIQSLGIVVAAIIIKINNDYKIVDPICTFLFAFLGILTTIPILCQIFKVFMEATPPNVNTDKMAKDLRKVEGVEEVHDLHVWALNLGNSAMSCHLKTKTPMLSLKKATRLINTKYKILHTTIQVENFDETFKYDCEPHH